MSSLNRSRIRRIGRDNLQAVSLQPFVHIRVKLLVLGEHDPVIRGIIFDGRIGRLFSDRAFPKASNADVVQVGAVHQLG